MQKKAFDITLIGYGLALLYVTSMLSYIKALQMNALMPHSAILISIYAVLTVGAIGLVQLRERSRKTVVILNFFLAFYLAYLYTNFQGKISGIYIIMNVVTFFYFSQPRVKGRFLAGPLPSSWKCILVVDDDETLIKTVRPILIAKGYSVLSASSGEEGLHIAQNQKPDLIFLDVILPGIKGREVCLRLKEDALTKNIPIIFLTAKDSPDDIKAEMEAGAETHLTKPIDAKLLVSTVEKVLSIEK